VPNRELKAGLEEKALAAQLLLVSLLAASATPVGELSGFTTVETRFFTESPGFPQQHGSIWSPSAVLQPEFRQEWNEGRDRFTARFPSPASMPTNRVAAISICGSLTSFTFGLGKVFWGVAESRHLIDIVNQTDLVENIDQTWTTHGKPKSFQ
jgi:hypothetical protein